MGLLVNIDNGGTFTDVCISSGDRVLHAKTPTTPHDLTQCFIDVLTRASEQLYGEPDLRQLIQNTDYLRYSTTSGTNAVVERKGTPVGLLVDAGEEQSVYGALKSYGSSELWQIMVPGEPVAIPMSGDAVDEKALVSVVNDVLSTGVSRLVIALRSRDAEVRVKEALLESYPRHLLGAVPFLVSHELSADTDDARRTFSAVVNSFLHPGMEHFLYGAENVCKTNFLQRPLLIFRNDGNSARVAKTTAIKTWGSGPRGGLEGAAAYAKHYGIESLATMDIGGTTTDVSVLTNAKVALLGNGNISGLKTSFALPRLDSYGLGGSSIITVNDGAIQIGPESVGAAPGPACYARGGQSATLTDALLIAGILDGDGYLGGDLKLDQARAEQALTTHVAEPLKLSLEAAVAAVMTAFNDAVGDELASGLTAASADPAKSALLAYGGAGPMVACGIASAAGIKRVIIPSMSPVFSAFGVGFSDIAHDYQMPVTNGDLSTVQERLLERARRDMYGEGVDVDACDYEFSGLVRDGDLVEHAAVSADNTELHLKAAYPLPNFTLEEDKQTDGHQASAVGKATVYGNDGKRAEIDIFDADRLNSGSLLSGPALLRSNYLTCLVEPGWSLRVSANQDLILEAE